MTTDLPSGFNSLTRPVTEKNCVLVVEMPAVDGCPADSSLHDETAQANAASSSPANTCRGSTRFISIIGQEPGTSARNFPKESVAVARASRPCVGRHTNGKTSYA